MRRRQLVHASIVGSAVALALFGARHASAQDAPFPADPYYSGSEQRSSSYMDPAAREAWLSHCRQTRGRRDSGLGGAAIGGVVGGIAGNRIAGRGNRTVGTIAGAAVGAAAGMAIDQAEDRRQARDECERYLDDYYAYYEHYARGGYGQGYAGYQPPYSGTYGSWGGCCYRGAMMMVPAVRQAEPECTETVEYITEEVPVASPPPRAVRQKRVKTTPDKRIMIK